MHAFQQKLGSPEILSHNHIPFVLITDPRIMVDSPGQTLGECHHAVRGGPALAS